jgi:hypothetical protein
MALVHTKLCKLAPHADHDMALFLGLHRELNSSTFDRYPKAVKRSLNVAYATLLRSLLPFFHGKRPKRRLKATDLTCQQYLENSPDANGDPFAGWSDAEEERLDDADKLAAHLSTLRSQRTANWGRQEDLEMLKPKIEHLIDHFGDGAEDLFPHTVAEL